MRFEGRLKSWNDDRGFGFIEPSQGGQEIFVHIKAFPSGTGRPVPNLPVSFEVEQSSDGKKRAKDVLFVRPARSRLRATAQSHVQWEAAGILALSAFALTYLVVTLVWAVSLYFALGYLVMSLICGLAYAGDKHAAQTGGWRTSEGTLLMLGLFGGWPGAIIAQQLFRHKTSKASFRAVFWVTVSLNVAGFLAISTPLIRAVRG